MAETQIKDNFEFEIEGEEREVTPVQKPIAVQQETKGKPEPDIEVIDDTPAEDRGRQPMPQNLVEEIEKDELEEYSDRAKQRLHQLKKVYHDERRAKESADRERAEALVLAKRLLEENQKLRGAVTDRDTALAESMKEAAQRALQSAKTAFREAYESGDAEKIAEAQEKLTSASIRFDQSEKFKPTPLQEEGVGVNNAPEPTQVSKPDQKAVSWQEQNPWFGRNRIMTAMALGLHEDLVAERGVAYATTDEYYDRIDKMMRSKFPEEFGDAQTTNGGGKPVTRTEKPATVVAPASRSTSSKKIVLKQSELALAKKLNLTPEQYAREKMRLENQNG